MENLSVTYNSNDLSLVSGVTLYNYVATDLPDRDIKISKLARRSLSVITSSEYTQKSIQIMMNVCSGSRADTEATITRVKGMLQPQNGNLRVNQNGKLFEYTATMNGFDIEWLRQRAYVTIQMIASTPIAETVQPTSLGSTSITSSSTTIPMLIEGSYPAEPEITITLNTLTGGTSKNITVMNSSTNVGITITDNYSNGDIIVIDSSRLSVTKNGVEVDYSGGFPVFGVGAQTLGYSDTLTTRSVDIAVNYNERIV